jgi:hypothetical protein
MNLTRKLPIPPFYPLADLAIAWACSEALLHVYAEHGIAGGAEKLRVAEYELAGEKVLGVSHEEKGRFEALRCPASKAPRINGKERESLLALTGPLLILWCGGDRKYLDHPYVLVADIEQAAAANGAPMLRGDDTNAKLVAEAIALMRANGYAQLARAEAAHPSEPPPRAEEAA